VERTHRHTYRQTTKRRTTTKYTHDEEEEGMK
jgi:hypothetical protein